MITGFHKRDFDPNSQEARTEGCGCCSATYNLNTEQDKIKEELKDNITIVFRLCASVGWYCPNCGYEEDSPSREK